VICVWFCLLFVSSVPLMQRRAAFDIGSGSTKLVVADVTAGRIEKVLFGKEYPVGFALDWKRSSENLLSEEVQQRGLEVLGILVQECEVLDVAPESRAAIATEVFRKALNGAAFLARVHEKLGLRVEVITQDDEAVLGFATAVALEGREDVIAWDSGGASFQITSRDSGLRTYLGTFGSGNTTAMLVQDIQGLDFSEHASPNPVSREQADALVKLLLDGLNEGVPWLRGQTVTAIGGPNSMFAVATECIGVDAYTLKEVESALADSLNRTDEELAVKHGGELREPTGLVCPKLALLVAVMQRCEIKEVSFKSAVGSCSGLLISSGRYV